MLSQGGRKGEGYFHSNGSKIVIDPRTEDSPTDRN